MKNHIKLDTVQSTVANLLNAVDELLPYANQLADARLNLLKLAHKYHKSLPKAKSSKSTTRTLK